MRRTVAIFTDGGFLAHVTRTFEVARVLRAAFGHRVVFCGAGPYMDIPRSAGFEVRPVYTVDRDVTMRLARRAGLCDLRWWRAECARSVDSDLEALREIRPDLVIGDMHWSLCTSARVLGIPYVAITNAAWTRWYAEPIEPPQGHFSTKIFGERLTRRLFPRIKELLTWYYSLGYTDVRKRHGLPPVSSIYDLIEGDVTLLADVPEFMAARPGMPSSFRYVGPILWDANLPPPSWLKRIDRRRPTLYFTMGSTGDAEFFNEAIRVFGGTEYQVIITTGGLADLGAVPDNVFVEKYANGQALLDVADAVISHGGNGTIYQALSRGVPIVGFPSIFDQEINMQRVTALGAGLRMWRSQYDARALKAAVETILGDGSYRASCRRLARCIAHYHGPRRAAVHVDHLLAIGAADFEHRPEDVTSTIHLLASLDAA
jgi:MGT family glycosyltransferase